MVAALGTGARVMAGLPRESEGEGNVKMEEAEVKLEEVKVEEGVEAGKARGGEGAAKEGKAQGKGGDAGGGGGGKKKKKGKR